MSKSEAFLDWQTLINLGAMIEHDEVILVTCTACKGSRYLAKPELVSMAEKVGRDYSLKNRRTPCRFSGACQGWNWFHYRRGVYLPFRDQKTALRWMCGGPSKPELL